MPSSIHAKLRDFQGAREMTGRYRDDSNKNRGYKLYNAQEDAGKRPLIMQTTTYCFIGAKYRMRRGETAVGMLLQDLMENREELSLTELVPNHAALGSPSFTIHVIGTGFGPGAVIVWNNSDEPTTFVSTRELTTVVNMATAEAAVTLPVKVRQAGAETGELPFTFDPAARVRK